MSESTRNLIAVIVSGMFGVPTMTFLGKWIAVQMGYREKRQKKADDLAEELRQGELKERLAWREQQQHELTTMRQTNRELEEQLRKLAVRHDELERKYTTMQSTLGQQVDEVTRLRAENVSLAARVKDLEQELLAAYQEVARLRRQGVP